LRDPAGRFDPAATAGALLALRVRAERALGRPVTHAAIVVSEPLDASVRNALSEVALASGLVTTRVLLADEAAGAGAGTPVHGAAIAAEDDAAAAARR
jgi:hypothetical protein